MTSAPGADHGPVEEADERAAPDVAAQEAGAVGEDRVADRRRHRPHVLGGPAADAPAADEHVDEDVEADEGAEGERRQRADALHRAAEDPLGPAADAAAERLLGRVDEVRVDVQLLQRVVDPVDRRLDLVLDGRPLLDDADRHEREQGEGADDDEHRHDERAPGAPDVMTLEPVDDRHERGAEQDGEQRGHDERRQQVQRVGEPDQDDDDPDGVPAGDADALEPVGDEAAGERSRLAGRPAPRSRPPAPRVRRPS